MAEVVIFKPNKQMDFMLQNQYGLVGRYIARKGREITLAAKRQVGVSTGQLQKSIHMRHRRDGAGQFIEVGSTVSHALVHHEGARPHIIVANRAQSLRFTSGGRVIYTRQVAHPGTRPNRYLKDNLYLAIL